MDKCHRESCFQGHLFNSKVYRCQLVQEGSPILGFFPNGGLVTNKTVISQFSLLPVSKYPADRVMHGYHYSPMSFACFFEKSIKVFIMQGFIN